MKPLPRLLWTPADAIEAAHADLFGNVLEPDRCYIRYLWLRDWEPEENKKDPTRSETVSEAARRASFTINLVSRGYTIITPDIVQGGHLLRLDLRNYDPCYDGNSQHRQYLDGVDSWQKIWEEFTFDPSFSKLLTRDSLAFAAKLDPSLLHTTVEARVAKRIMSEGKTRHEQVTVDHKGGDYTYPDGSGTVHNVKPGRYSVDLTFHEPGAVHYVTETKHVSVAEALEDYDVIRLDPSYIDALAFNQLREATHSNAPIVELDYFQFRATSQIQENDNKVKVDGKVKDDKVFTTIFGGLYYRLRGIRKSKQEGITDQQLFFQDFLGINVKDAANNAKALFERLNSDQRSLKYRSDITGKPRIGVFIPSLGSRFFRSGGSFTLDVKDASIDLGERAFANLLNPFAQAIEGIFIAENGMPVCVLFNPDDGSLVDEVPFNVANDTTIPHPYTQRLQPAGSCLACHKEDMWKPFPNQVRTITRGHRGINIFGDLSAGLNYGEAFSPKVIDRLASLYGGDLDTGLSRARYDFMQTAIHCIGTRRSSTDQTDAGRHACSLIESGRNNYWYSDVTPKVALHDLGIEAPTGEPLVTDPDSDKIGWLDRIVPPYADSIQYNPHLSYIPEDPRIPPLRAGLGINRSDWALGYSFFQERALTAEKKEGIRP